MRKGACHMIYKCEGNVGNFARWYHFNYTTPIAIWNDYELIFKF
jgi:hypothetical protein